MHRYFNSASIEDILEKKQREKREQEEEIREIRKSNLQGSEVRKDD